MSSAEYIYIIGAGRSGTTIAALFLQYLDGTTLLGELNHLGEFLLGQKKCACERNSSRCEFRDELISSAVVDGKASQYAKEAQSVEAHNKYLHHFRNRFLGEHVVYSAVNTYIASDFCKGRTVIDSGKYVSRGLALKNLLNRDVRFLWITRDPRGVVHSFRKRVQTSRGTLSACFYYNAVNIAVFAASVTLLKGRIKRLKYEELLLNPEQSLYELGDYFGLQPSSIVKDQAGNIRLPKPEHMLGGNRLIESTNLVMSTDEVWREDISTLKRYFIWLLCFPASMVFGYTP